MSFYIARMFLHKLRVQFVFTVTFKSIFLDCETPCIHENMYMFLTIMRLQLNLEISG